MAASGVRRLQQTRKLAKRRKVFKGSQQRLSRKIAIVRSEDPKLTIRQVVGKAAGILAQRDKKRRKR